MEITCTTCFFPQEDYIRLNLHTNIMRYIVLLLLIVLIIASMADGAKKRRRKRGKRRCRRAIAQCSINGTMTEYDTCKQICCGKKLYDIDESFVKCCGDHNYGEVFFTDSEMCCAWPPGEEYGIHNKSESESISCCGADLIDYSGNTHISCCNGWNTKPEPFNTLDSMCCQGHVGYIVTTAHAECCYDVPFDRRFSSCPCNNGKLLKASKWEGECCRSGGNSADWNPYIKKTQGCCDGDIYELDTQICCNGIIANASTEYCCNGRLTAQDPTTAGNVNIGCCPVGGDEVIYDMEFQTCCGGLLFDRPTEGDECCSVEPYFSTTEMCCNNTVFVIEEFGDQCCAGEPFSSESGVCCGGSIVGVNLVWPACCVMESFDAYTDTCCGSTIYPNPPGPDGTTSHHTRCCGDFADPSTLFPYDYDLETCCNGVNASLFRPDGKKIDQNNRECCGELAMDNEDYLCCDEVVALNPYGEFGRCFGNTTYDIRVEIYCEGIRIVHSFGEFAVCCGADAMDSTASLCCEDVVVDITFENAECCGTEEMNSDEFKCCDAEPRSLNGIPKEKAVCCGDACIDGRDYWCCEGKAYWKGANNGEEVEGLNCDEFFKPDIKPARRLRNSKRQFGAISFLGTPKPTKTTTAKTTTTKATTTETTTTTTEAPKTEPSPPPTRRTRRPRRG